MNTNSPLEEAICLAALEVADPAQRERFLERACAGDACLRSAVEEMLSLHQDAQKFFARGKSAVASAQMDFTPTGSEIPAAGAGSSDAVDDQIGTRLGHYKILQKMGEGGWGSVYMAEQEHPVRRQVAVKIIKPGMDSKSIIARFEAERQALALMDHPNIARVLDAGTTESGRPFFVMELVRGLRITQFCDENNFDARQRLELFIKVCHAIQHAHLKGIIHRDIKPSNILVTMIDGAAIPKVIDFGIAKAVEGRLTENPMVTACEQFVGTPAYMSPEQAEMSGFDVDTRSDIYSLGVLLYELLSGKTPFDSKVLMQSGWDEMRKTLREKEPPAPSTMITSMGPTEMRTMAGLRHAEPPKLISQLKGDLDWIVMMALEKDRNRRYQTANGFAMDVQRYLKNEPVIARPPSRIYRLQKLVKRNKVVFAAAAVVAVTLLAGFGISTWMFFREHEARREQAQLREKAERSEKRENELRQQAEAREQINQAAIFVSQEKFEDANRMLEGIKTPPPKPSFDGVSAYRSVGDWLASQGRWAESADRYLALMEIDKLDKWGAVTLDYQACGVVLVESGRREQYKQFCRSMVAGFDETSNGDAAGRILKTCLLLPPDEALMKQLKPMAAKAEDFFTGTDPKQMNGWSGIPVGLWCYRCGDYAQAAEWCRRSLDAEDKTGAQHATLRTILALCDYQTGRTNEAQLELSQTRETVAARVKDIRDRGDGAFGYWYDWQFAQILLREALGVQPAH